MDVLLRCLLILGNGSVTGGRDGRNCLSRSLVVYNNGPVPNLLPIFIRLCAPKDSREARVENLPLVGDSSVSRTGGNRCNESTLLNDLGLNIFTSGFGVYCCPACSGLRGVAIVIGGLCGSFVGVSALDYCVGSSVCDDVAGACGILSGSSVYGDVCYDGASACGILSGSSVCSGFCAKGACGVLSDVGVGPCGVFRVVSLLAIKVVGCFLGLELCQRCSWPRNEQRTHLSTSVHPSSRTQSFHYWTKRVRTEEAVVKASAGLACHIFLFMFIRLRARKDSREVF